MLRLYLSRNDKGATEIVRYSPALPVKQDSGCYIQDRSCVGLYLNDRFVQNVPYQALFRFSAAANAVFKEMSSPGDGAAALTVSGAASPCRRSGRSRDRRRVDSMNLIGDEDDDEDDSFQGPELFRTFSLPNSSRLRSRSRPGDLYLSLENGKTIDIDAVHEAIKWMKENCLSQDERLMRLGPARLETASLKTLVDMYSAIRVFQLQPKIIEKRYKHEIMIRLSTQPPSLRSMRLIGERVPGADSIITRLITSIHQHWESNTYPDETWSSVSSLLFASHGEFCEKAKRIFQSRRHIKCLKEGSKDEQHTFERQRALVDDWLDGNHPSSLPEKPVKYGGGKAHSHRGRRDRRKKVDIRAREHIESTARERESICSKSSN